MGWRWWALAASSAALGLVLVALTAPGSAFAYTVPSGLGSNTTLCPARPAELSTAVAAPVALNGQPVVPANGSYTSGSATNAGGEAEVYFVAGPPGYLRLQVQDSAGNWDTILQLSSVTFGTGSLVFLPPGPVRVVIISATGTDQEYDYSVTAAAVDAGANYTAQELADGCQLTVSNQSQTHGDLGQLHTDLGELATSAQVTALTSALNSFSAQNHTDLSEIISSLSSGGGTGGGGSSGPSSTLPQLVELSSADRQMTADVSSSNHQDLYVIVGAIIGIGLFDIALRKLWP